MQSVDIPTFSDVEYHQHLHDESWSRSETDHLLELCKRFDLRFIIVHDRWDTQRFSKRSVEDLKERYYHIANTLAKVEAYKTIVGEVGCNLSSLIVLDLLLQDLNGQEAMGLQISWFQAGKYDDKIITKQNNPTNPKIQSFMALH